MFQIQAAGFFEFYSTGIQTNSNFARPNMGIIVYRLIKI